MRLAAGLRRVYWRLRWVLRWHRGPARYPFIPEALDVGIRAAEGVLASEGRTCGKYAQNYVRLVEAVIGEWPMLEIGDPDEKEKD